MTKIATLYDAFDGTDIDSEKWLVTGTPVVADGVVAFNAWIETPEVITSAAFDWADSECVIRLADLSASPSGTPAVGVGIGTGHFVLYDFGGQGKTIIGVDQSAPVVFDGIESWFRFRVGSAPDYDVYIDSSEDGTTWDEKVGPLDVGSLASAPLVIGAMNVPADSNGRTYCAQVGTEASTTWSERTKTKTVVLYSDAAVEVSADVFVRTAT